MKKRIFVALDISEEAREKTSGYIKKLREQFPKVRAGWDKPEKLHLTMKFLGEIDDEQLAKLINAVEKTASGISPLKLQIAGTGVFPSPRPARVMWIDVKGEEEKLRLLSETLENECEKQGFEKEKRRFKAHLTIARLKERASEMVQAHLREDFTAIEFEVSEIVIYQSQLKPTGSIYSVISKHKFRSE
jgi:2'-5' RNA ligase